MTPTNSATEGDGAGRRPGHRFGRRGLLAGAAAVGVTTAAASAEMPAAAGADVTTGGRTFEVIVVGAGLAGLTAATSVARSGRSVLVLEARDRVGGRNYDIALAPGVVVEMGGQWTGPGQTRVQALAHQLGVGLFPTYSAGESLYYHGGRLQAYTGEIPPASPTALVELERTITALNQMASGVSADTPWDAAQSAAYDAQTIASWIAAQNYSEEATFLAGLSIRADYGEEASQVSLMDLLAEITGVGGDFNTVIGSAQSTRFVGGPQQLSKVLARRLARWVRLSSPVLAVEQGRIVTVHTAAAAFRARQLIVTVPKAVTAAIRFQPALPAAFAQYLQRQPSGATVKIQAVYDTPFWRPQGLSGAVTSDTGPIEIVYDNSPPSGVPGVLVGLAEGDQGRSLFGLSSRQRRQTVLNSLARYFGPRAAQPTHYADMVWAHEPYSGGAYGSFNPPGVITSLGESVSGPVGNIHFAGADYSPSWPGYMEGAIRSGEATAREVLDAR